MDEELILLCAFLFVCYGVPVLALGLGFTFWYRKRSQRRAALRREGLTEEGIRKLEVVESLQQRFTAFKMHLTMSQKEELAEMLELGELDVERAAEGKVKLDGETMAEKA